MGDDVFQVISGDKWRKIRTLLLSPTSDTVELGLFVLEWLVPPAVDLESFLGASAVRTLGRLADGWLLDAHDALAEWLDKAEFNSLLRSEESAVRKGFFTYADRIIAIPPLDTLKPEAGESSHADSAAALAAFLHYQRVVVQKMFLARAGGDAGSCSPLIDLVQIPEGDFTMGTEEHPWCRPVRRVQITKPFMIGRTAVTQGQWRQVMGTAPWSNKHGIYRGSGEGHIVREQDDVAATCVSWPADVVRGMGGSPRGGEPMASSNSPCLPAGCRCCGSAKNWRWLRPPKAAGAGDGPAARLSARPAHGYRAACACDAAHTPRGSDAGACSAATVATPTGSQSRLSTSVGRSMVVVMGSLR